MLLGLKKKNTLTDMIVNKSDSSQILNKKIFSFSGMLCIYLQYYDEDDRGCKIKSVYLQLRSLKTNIVYGDAQAWLSNFLSHQ